MRITKYVISILMVASLLGCSTTGGSIGGLFPAPKFLKGKIEGNMYVSKDNDFEIQIPHIDGSDEFLYMQVKEQYNNSGAYISFGPAALDKSIYRVEIGKKLSPESKDVNFAEATNALVANYIKQLEKGYNAAVSLSKKEKTTINGVPSYFILLEQSAQGETLDHIIYAANYETMAVVTWVQMPSNNYSEATISALEFARSFKVTR